MRVLLAATILLCSATAGAIEIRFAMPEFDNGYTLPDLSTPLPPGGWGIWDSLILFSALALSTFFVFKTRSRKHLFGLSVFSVAYFGFFRDGCICPVGSTQNVAAAILLPDVGVSPVVLSFFVMPLLFSLFYGRVFCASVCPLGAIQEVVAVRPIRISPIFDRVLGLGRYLYLGLAIVGVATGAGFIICRFDPFVGIFRMTDNRGMLLAGGLMLLVGVFIARPYCRFLCPYGVLLGWMSKFSKYHLDIPPTKCVQCRLCEDSCPYNAIEMPTPEINDEDRAIGLTRIKRYVYLTPVFILVGALAGAYMNELLAQMHPHVPLSDRIKLEDAGVYTEQTLESESFRMGSMSVPDLHAEVASLRSSFRTGGAWLGSFIGLTIVLKLIFMSVHTKRDDFTPNRNTCFSCGRCYPYCPVETDEEQGAQA